MNANIMRSNFIKVFESCTVCDFSRSFYKCSIRILTVCLWELAQVGALEQEVVCGYVESPEGLAQALGFAIIYHTNAIGVLLVERTPSGGERSEFQTEAHFAALLFTLSAHKNNSECTAWDGSRLELRCLTSIIIGLPLTEGK